MTLAPELAAPGDDDLALAFGDCATATSEAETGPFAVAEFFAGIGLARLGLESAGAGFTVTWANDLDDAKHGMYQGHFRDADPHYHIEDIRAVAEDPDRMRVPKDLSLAWASFPCTDLSVAGGREGLAGKHSGTFWPFTDVLEGLGDCMPPVVAIENVNGFATSHRGADIKAATARLNQLGYSVDVLALDARRWIPQSRPRLFLIAAQRRPDRVDDRRDTELRPLRLNSVLDDPGLITHRAQLPEPPPVRTRGWSTVVEPDTAPEVEWWDGTRTTRFECELSEVQNQRVKDLADEAAGKVVYRTAYRRTRNGKPAWEIRADDVAGCLRTSRGGSSKQAVVRIQQGRSPRVRWMTAREYAALMGAPGYRLPPNRNQSIMGFGDAVCVDAVRWLAKNYLGPLLHGRL